MLKNQYHLTRFDSGTSKIMILMYLNGFTSCNNITVNIKCEKYNVSRFVPSQRQVGGVKKQTDKYEHCLNISIPRVEMRRKLAQ